MSQHRPRPPGHRPQHRRPSDAMAWTRIALCVFAPVALAAAVYVNRFTLVWLVSGYGLLAVGRVAAQTWMALVVRRRFSMLRSTPMVSIIVTVFDPESLAMFTRVARSLARQRWPHSHYEVIVVDDGSGDPLPHQRLCDRFGFRYMYQTNVGKRRALHRAFQAVDPRSEYVLTADDDTIWHRDSTAHLVAAMQASPRVGATTGHVATLNANESWLTRLVAARYWVAFEVERAAQAFRGTVTCVSGPLGAYRRDLIDRVADDFVNQRFLGRQCTFGDDRHLTNLILGLGYQVTYSRAVAWTHSPATFRRYRRQQTRWGKSAWREMLWTFRALPKHSLLLSTDWVLTLLLPFLLIGSMAWYGFRAVTGHPAHLLGFAAMVVGMALLRAIPGVIATRRWPLVWLLPAFSLFHLVVLLPLKFWSLVTVADGRWGTRDSTVADTAALTAPTVLLQQVDPDATRELTRVG